MTTRFASTSCLLQMLARFIRRPVIDDARLLVVLGGHLGVDYQLALRIAHDALEVAPAAGRTPLEVYEEMLDDERASL